MSGESLEALGAGNQRFALQLFRRLARERPGANVFFSPAGLQVAIGMLLAGARGETAHEVRTAAGFPDKPDDNLHRAIPRLVPRLGAQTGPRPEPGVGLAPGPGDGDRAELVCANALWLRRGIEPKPDYAERLRAHYRALIEALDFANDPRRACERVNAWCREHTGGKIPSVLDPDALPDDLVLVLTNAIYFFGSWEHPFERGLTAPAPFHLAGGGRREARLMHQRDTFRYAEDDSLQALEMSYFGGRLAMLVLLPRAPDGIDALERELDPARLAAVIGALRSRQVAVWLPRFKLECDYRLGATLADLGMRRVMSHEADLSGMAEVAPLFLSEVVHRSFVEVFEEGTEAAAVTAMMVALGMAGAPEPVPEFRADRPFVFAIRDRETGSLLFLGSLKEPPDGN